MNTEQRVCRDFIDKNCKRGDNCKFSHPTDVCRHFWKHGDCKFKEECKYKHVHSVGKKEKRKNTETWIPKLDPCDIRIVMDLSTDKCKQTITSRDVLLVPNLFSRHRSGEIYFFLEEEIKKCKEKIPGVEKKWHGTVGIEGTHTILDDRRKWKELVPTFCEIVSTIQSFFNMRVEATRLNIYDTTADFKPFHHDSSAVNIDKAKIQNFTVAVSFGATRDAAFEHAKTKTTICCPQKDGQIYAFSKDTNIIWRHGILAEKEVRKEGRISIILWGWIDGMID